MRDQDELAYFIEIWILFGDFQGLVEKKEQAVFEFPDLRYFQKLFELVRQLVSFLFAKVGPKCERQYS